MSIPRREVRMHPDFEREAKENFPPGGSVEGRPSYELFLARPLVAFQAAFQHWERNAMPLPGVHAIRSADVANDPFFPLLVAIATLMIDPDGQEYIELSNLMVDWDYPPTPDDDDSG